MESFKDWLQKIEYDIAAEAATVSGGGSTSTGDIAGNPYGAGIQYYDKSRDQYGMLKKNCKDKVGGCEGGLGGKVIPMKFSSGKVVS